MKQPQGVKQPQAMKQPQGDETAAGDETLQQATQSRETHKETTHHLVSRFFVLSPALCIVDDALV